MILTVIVTLQVVPGYSRATEVPLPQFSVTDLQGNVVSSDTLNRSETWVLIAVAPNNQPSRALLNELQTSKIVWSDRVVIIVSGDLTSANAMEQQNSKLGSAKWYRDADGNVMRNLGLSGWPAVMGIVPGNFIAWRSMGVPEASKSTQGLVANWIGLVVKP